jgi:lipopolysaccharide export LptBFGC system permease protein LptF
MRRTGVRLRTLAARWFDAPTMERYLDPLLADLQSEYEEAIGRGRVWRSRWIWAAGHLAFAKVIVLVGSGQSMRWMREATDDERRAGRRILACGAAVLVLSTLLFVAPFYFDFLTENPDAAKLLVLLVPQALPLALPLGLLFGVLCGVGRRVPLRRLRVMTLFAAAAASGALLVMLAWVIPAANQAFRVAMFEARARAQVPEGRMFSGSISKGANELTLGELRQFFDSRAPDALPAPPDDLRKLALVYHGRLSLAATPVVVALFAFALTRLLRRRPLVLGVAGFGAVVCAFAIHIGGRVIELDDVPSTFAIAWAPNVTFLIVSILLSTMPAERPSLPAGDSLR